MGPFDWARQQERYTRLDALASNLALSKEMREMWARKRDGLAQTESDYNCRVKEVYKDIKGALYEQKRFILCLPRR